MSGPTPLLPPPPKREQVRWHVVESTLGGQRGGPYFSKPEAERAREQLAKKDPSEAATLRLERRATLESDRPAPAPPGYGPWIYPWA